MIRVTQLGLAPVKGMRWRTVDELRLTAGGAEGDRRFLVVGDPGHELLLTTRTARLTAVSPAWDGTALALALPDGTVVRDEPRPGRAVRTHTYEGRALPGRLVESDVLTEALSAHLGRAVRLVERDAAALGADDAAVSLMSVPSLEALAPALDGATPDPRRFRMNVTVDGVDPWEEHGWGGREVEAGDALLRVVAPVPRCVVTTRDPDTGARDVPTLKALARLRGKADVTFGVWLDVLRPGTIRTGDEVRPRA